MDSNVTRLDFFKNSKGQIFFQKYPKYLVTFGLVWKTLLGIK